jgi:thiosulfate reductase cytochrome b subunit
MAMTQTQGMAPPRSAPNEIYRHRLLVRATHWVNALVMLVMVLSGLQIFNAHPALYWGQQSNFTAPVLAMTAERTPNGLKGVTTVLGQRVVTTGVFGVSPVHGAPTPRGFPAWMTLPGQQWLAMGRRYHFFFAWFFVANGLIYIAWSLYRRHLQKDLLPSWAELKQIPHVFWEHLRFHFPKGEEAKVYNVLQKLAYVGVAFVLGPLIVLTGLTMSPAMDTSFPFLLDVFGGRQSARTIHFLCAFGFVAFFGVHIFMVLVSGVGNNLRSMLTGWYRIKAAPAAAKAEVPHHG